MRETFFFYNNKDFSQFKDFFSKEGDCYTDALKYFDHDKGAGDNGGWECWGVLLS